jgi:BlaI family penicillinase repressor
VHIILADREAEFMEALWRLGPSTVAEVRKELPDKLAYTTVLTILRNLEANVGHDAEGRAHRYAPLVARDAARNSALKDLAAKFFGGSTELLMTHLVSDRRLSETEVKRIRKLLDQQTPKGRR